MVLSALFKAYSILTTVPRTSGLLAKMTTRIGIISDIHSTLAPLEQAIDIFNQHKVDLIICAGDVAGYGEDELAAVIRTLQANNCLTVSGNHDHLPDQLQHSLHADFITQFFHNLPLHICLTMEGKKIYVVHAQPPNFQHGGIKLLDPEGNIFPDRLNSWSDTLKDFNYDVLIIGHTHQVFNTTIAGTQVINPGSTQFNHSCMILSLPDMQVETFALSNKEIITTWNWGWVYRENSV